MTVEIDFSEKTVVVVGGTSGINRGVAEAFARHGATIAVASRSQDKVDDTVASLTALGARRAMGAAFDVRSFDDVSAAMGAIHAELGSIDVLVSGAAGNFPALTSEMSVNAFRTVVDIDLIGTMHVMKAAYPLLTRPGASIMNISAPQAYLPYEAQAHVCAAKAGVDQITRTLALEWGPEGIRVNSVVPGYIDETEGMKRLAGDPKVRARIVDQTPLQRLGVKQDVANACLFLASDLAGFVSGHVIPVDGGAYLRGSADMGKALGDMMRAAKG